MFVALYQCFSNLLSWSTPSPAHFVCLPHLSHLIQLISSLVETARPEVGVSDIGRHKKCEVLLGVLHGEVSEPLPYTIHLANSLASLFYYSILTSQNRKALVVVLSSADTFKSSVPTVSSTTPQSFASECLENLLNP